MIYLDSAATSLQKPESVSYAVLEAMSCCASPGRGGHAAASRAADRCFCCRERLADFLGVAEPERVIFTFNATHGLNIALSSLIRKGSRVLVSGYEHNAVMRPLRALEAETELLRTPLFDPDTLLEAFARRIPFADVAVFTHVSNVFGYILPVEEMAALCRKYAKPFVIDASQSAGVLPVRFDAWGADFAAMPGHKGLLGPQGTGVLLCKDEARPLLYGGTGSDSRMSTMPVFLPDRLEAGTHNVAGIAGLDAAVSWLQRQKQGAILTHEQECLALLAEALDGAPLQLFRAQDPQRQSGVLSFLPNGWDVESFADALSANGVAVRAGLHCAPCAHETAGTVATGTVRVSFSPFLAPEEILTAAEQIKNLWKNDKKSQSLFAL